MTSPPVICGDVVVVGSSIWDFPDCKEMPPGDVRGFDVRTGKRAVDFHTIPQEGEPGNETWENESWKYTGNANVWALMSADDELGYVYLPFSTPTNDYYGGHRRATTCSPKPGLPRRDDRQARLALPDRASWAVGLRPARARQR